MAKLSELIEEGKRHDVVLTNREGKRLIELSLLWTVIIAVAAPQAALLVAVLWLLDVVGIEYDGRQVTLASEGGEKEPAEVPDAA